MLKNSLLKIQKRPNIGLSGEYRLVVRRVVDGGVTRDTGWIPNLITNAGLNRLGSGGWSGWCHIGTGTTAPAVGDVALAVQAASTNSTAPGGGNSNSGSPLYRTTATLVYRFNAGQLNGNYTEVGISWSNSTLWSRALIVDGGGSPTSITVTSSEFLDVFYRLTMVPDLTDHNYSCTIQGVNYGVTRRASWVGSAGAWNPNRSGAWIPAGGQGSNIISAYSGTLGAVTGFPSGTQATKGGSPSVGAYVNNSYTRTSSVSIALGELNVPGGIKSIAVDDSVGSWQHQFSPVIPKDDTKVMSLSFSMSWGRV